MPKLIDGRRSGFVSAPLHNSHKAAPLSEITIQEIEARIKNKRDQLIGELFDDSSLMSFLERHYNTVAVSLIRLKGLKNKLHELQSSPLDLSFYTPMIRLMGETRAKFPVASHPLFLKELKCLFEKNGF